MIGILSDQHAGDAWNVDAVFRPARLDFAAPGVLCKRTGAALIAASHLHKRAREMAFGYFSSPFDSPNDNIASLTAKMNAVIADEIRRTPEDWFWVHNRWKTPKPNWLLRKYKRGVFMPETVGSKDLKPFRVLIRASNWLGDSVISVPAVRAIKRGRPDAQMTILAPEKIAAVWRLVPEVDKVISLGQKSCWRAVGLIRKEPEFDAGVVFPNSFPRRSNCGWAGCHAGLDTPGTVAAGFSTRLFASPSGGVRRRIRWSIISTSRDR